MRRRFPRDTAGNAGYNKNTCAIKTIHTADACRQTIMPLEAFEADGFSGKPRSELRAFLRKQSSVWKISNSTQEHEGRPL